MAAVGAEASRAPQLQAALLPTSTLPFQLHSDRVYLGQRERFQKIGWSLEATRSEGRYRRSSPRTSQQTQLWTHWPLQGPYQRSQQAVPDSDPAPYP